MLRPVAAAVLVAVSLAACSSSATPAASPTPPALSQAEMIQQAEAAVKGELPDIPLWEGVTFAGSVVDDVTVCVDRTYPKGGGITGKGGNAGYVLVTFPAVTTGEPQDGVCADVSGAPVESSAPPVVVPDDVKDEPGLVTRDTLGEDWPLTVDYGVVACENKTAGGMDLKIATFTGPDGTVYALNGTAKDHTEAADITPIWAPDPDNEGAKISIGPLIDRALTFC